jgi:YHS domain-containing protein
LSVAVSRRYRVPALVASAALLAGCASMVAQNPSSPMQPVNAARNGDEVHLMLKGYDVVAYVAQNRATPGSPQYRSLYQGVTYHFASAENQAQFEREPARYQPAYHGYDAMRMVYAIPELADPEVWRMIDGRVFLFADAESKAAFELDLNGNVAMADKYWASEVAGSNSTWQALVRRFDRVPHYKSRDELARAVAAAQGKSG